MNEKFMKEVANALLAKAEKSILINIIKTFLANEETYDCKYSTYVVAKCIGKPSLTVEDVDMQKVVTYVNTYYTNKYSTIVEGSVKVLGVNPIRRSVKVSYDYTENESDEKEIRHSTGEIDAEYNDFLKDK